ncbi:MAG: hypothetical protein Q9170_007745, partial [Blastenia crenularia]
MTASEAPKAGQNLRGCSSKIESNQISDSSFWQKEPSQKQFNCSQIHQPTPLEDLERQLDYVLAMGTFDEKLFVPPPAYLSKKSSQQTLTPSIPPSYLSEKTYIKLRTGSHSCKALGIHQHLCFPPPQQKRRSTATHMKRVFLVTCATFALLALTVGAWMFAKSDPIYSWYAAYMVTTQFYLFTSLFITMLGRRFDVNAHKILLKRFPLDDDEAASVDIYLPVCSEPLELMENTWKFIARLRYPTSRISLYVPDDGASESVRCLAERFEFTYMCRPHRPEHKKAGNLRHAFANTSEQGASAVQEYIYRVMQHCKDRWGAAICVGSNAVYRRAALEPVGGVVAAEHTEDIYTGFWVTTHGWTLKEIPLVLACGVCPNTPRAFFSQQMRWCSGSVAMLLLKEFWTSNLSAKQKLCYLLGLVYYVTTAAQVILSPIRAPLILWSRPDLFKYYNLFFAFPSLLLDLVVLRIWTRTRYTLSVQYAQTVMSYAYLQGIWEICTGGSTGWVPSGKGGKAH